jgi:hypothetical protein
MIKYRWEAGKSARACALSSFNRGKIFTAESLAWEKLLTAKDAKDTKIAQNCEGFKHGKKYGQKDAERFSLGLGVSSRNAFHLRTFQRHGAYPDRRFRSGRGHA